MMPVVVVDDSREDLLLAQRVLQQCGLGNPILTFSSATEFLQSIHRSPPFACALLLLDIVMSPVDGVEVLRQLRAAKLLDHFPAVMVSGLNDIKALHQGYQLGARTFLLKPLSREDVLFMLRSLPGLSLKTTPAGSFLEPRPAQGRPGILASSSPGDVKEN